jgi:secondary thiamine-phosphate synthase enzyme
MGEGLTVIPVTTRSREEMVDITSELERVVRDSGVREGIAILQSLHTTGALTINENADPDVCHDVVAKITRLVPKEESYYRHAEGNSDSHVRTSLFGPSLTVIVSEGRPVLGTWQGVYFCEWDGPRQRKVAVKVIAG